MKKIDYNGKDAYIIESLGSVFGLPSEIIGRLLWDITKTASIVADYMERSKESGVEFLWVNEPTSQPAERLFIIHGKIRTPLGEAYEAIRVSDVAEASKRYDAAKAEDDQTRHPLSDILENLGLNPGDDPELEALANRLKAAFTEAKRSQEVKESKPDREIPQNMDELLKKLFGKGVRVMEMGCGEEDCDACNPTTH